MGSPQTDIWQTQTHLSQRLLTWAGLSIGAGLTLARFGDRFWRGVGAQGVGWGLIDGALALFGLRRARAESAQPEAHAPARQSDERAKLRRILALNTGLDVGYVLGGLALARSRHDKFWRGTGLGIVIQGGFLFVFDLLHVLNLREVRV